MTHQTKNPDQEHGFQYLEVFSTDVLHAMKQDLSKHSVGEHEKKMLSVIDKLILQRKKEHIGFWNS